MPRFSDYSFDDDTFDRPTRRKGRDRRAGAVSDLDDAFAVADGDLTLDDPEDWPDDDPPPRRGHQPRMADGTES